MSKAVQEAADLLAGVQAGQIHPAKRTVRLAQALVEATELLRIASHTINGLADQQAMPDDFYIPVQLDIVKFLKGETCPPTSST